MFGFEQIFLIMEEQSVYFEQNLYCLKLLRCCFASTRNGVFYTLYFASVLCFRFKSEKLVQCCLHSI